MASPSLLPPLAKARGFQSKTQNSESPTETSFVLIVPKTKILQIASRKLSVTTQNLDGLALYQAAHNNFKTGNITYIPWDYDHDMLIQTIKDSVLDYTQRTEHIVVIGTPYKIPASYLVAVHFFIKNQGEGENPFLNDKKLFLTLKKALIKDSHDKSHHSSIADYLNLLKIYDQKFQELPDNQFSFFLKQEWKVASERFRCYSRASGCGGKSKLIELFLTTVASKDPYRPAFQEFVLTIFSPLNLIMQLEQTLLLEKVLSRFC